MLEKILIGILENFLGYYLDGIDEENLKVGLWSGNIELKNVRIKSEFIDGLNLMFGL